LYTSSESNSKIQSDIAQAVLEQRGLSVVIQTVTNTNDVQQATRSLAQKCDAIYIPTDNPLASAMPTVGAVAEELKIPVVCGESNMVLAGGLATLGINYYNLGYQTGEMALRVLNGENVATLPVESLKKFDFTINAATVDALSLSVPEELKQYIVTP